MRTTGFLFFCVALVAVRASAQSSAVWPAGTASSAGGAAIATPFSVSPNTGTAGVRCFQLVSAAAVPFGRGAVLTGIAWRRDAVERSTTYAASSGTLQVRIGDIDDALHPSNTLQSPWSGSPTKVRDGSFSLPSAAPPAVGGVAAFDLVVPFSTPWTFAGNDFAIDAIYTGTAGRPWYRDAAVPAGPESGRVATLGAGCVGSTGFRPQAWIDAERAIPWIAGTLLARVSHLGGSASGSGYGPATCLVGFPRAQPLSLAALGFGRSCALHVDAVVDAPGVVGNASTLFGRAEIGWSLPNDPGLAGAALAMQWVATDHGSGAPAAFVASEAILVELGTAPTRSPVGRCVWAYGVSAFGPEFDGALGPIGYVPVTRFDWR